MMKVTRNASIATSSLAPVPEPLLLSEDAATRENNNPKVMFTTHGGGSLKADTVGGFNKKFLEKTMSLDEGKATLTVPGGVPPPQETSPAFNAELYWRRHMDHLMQNGIGKNKPRSHSVATTVIRLEDTVKPCSSEYNQALLDFVNGETKPDSNNTA